VAARSSLAFPAPCASWCVYGTPEIACDSAGMNAREFKHHLAELLRREQHAMADFILALSEFDQKKLWRDLEYPSLFSFLRSGLGLSAGAAQYRKTAAELVQRYPEVEEALRRGKLCMSSVVELAKVLTPENVTEVLPRFFGLSRREAADVVVSIRPVENPPLREVVTAVQSVPPPLTTPRPGSMTEDAEAPQLRPAEPARPTSDLLSPKRSCGRPWLALRQRSCPPPYSRSIRSGPGCTSPSRDGSSRSSRPPRPRCPTPTLPPAPTRSSKRLSTSSSRSARSGRGSWRSPETAPDQ